MKHLQVTMQKISKQIFNSEVTHHGYFNVFCYFLLNLQFFVFAVLTFLTFKFWFIFYILVLYSIFRKHILESSITDKFGKLSTVEFLHPLLLHSLGSQRLCSLHLFETTQVVFFPQNPDAVSILLSAFSI